MAISFKADKDYGYSLLPLFGVSHTIISQAKQYGVTVDQSSPGTFLVCLGGVTYGSVTVKGSAISLAKSKTLGPASKEALKYQFEGALNKAIAEFEKAGKEVDDVEVTSGTAHAKLVTPAFNPLKKAVPFKSAKAPVGKFSKADPVALCDATTVYQAVNGTTGGSVYFTLAIMEGLNISARVAGSKLSMRAEGPKLKFHQSALEDMGMDLKGDYASAHYDVANTGLLMKTLSAIVGRVGFNLVKEVADIQTFIGGQQ